MSRIFTLLAALLLLITVTVFVGCSDGVEKPMRPTYKTSLNQQEVSSDAFGREFPLQYSLFLKTKDSDLTTMTEFGGSVAYHKNDNVNPLPMGYRNAQPYLKNLWLGYPFSYEYNAARGHANAIRDILSIDRINQYDEKAGLPATCWNCKTTKIPQWVAEHGDATFWSMNFNEFRTTATTDMDNDTIGCATCHDPKTMDLVITSVPLAAALEREGVDWKTLERNEMRALVCAQCHVEYYFNDADKRPIFPWDQGKNPDQIYEYYKDKGISKVAGFEGNFVDWTHPVSATPMLKAQHPEYETWYDGPHGAAGVSCADCHMEYVRIDGKKKVSNHYWRSPLKNIDGACRQCHSDKSVEYLQERVEFTQKKVYTQLIVAQDLSVKAHEAVRLAGEVTDTKSANYTALMIDARQFVRQGQFYWDYVSAENSVGFHNPAKALETLAMSQQASQKAIDTAMQATNYAIGPLLAGEIRTIVPPILRHSRELQMDEGHLQSHKWLTYLPLLPKAERMWNLQDKLR